MLQEIQERLGMKVKGFQWVGKFVKAHRSHFVQFYGWNGEVYVQGKGILTHPEYYKLLLEKGLCLYVDGMIIAKDGISVHYNSLHKVRIKRLNQREAIENKGGYPVLSPDFQAVFNSAVDLYKQGFFTLEQLKERIQRYIQPEQQESVLDSIIQVA